MKILHTGDWHMNDRLGRIERGDHIVRALERVAGYLDERGVDVMVVAGDLFCDRSSKEDLRQAVGHIKRIFGPFLLRGGTIVAISGNHDSDVFFETLRDTLELAPAQVEPDGTASRGRLHLFARPALLRLADGAGVIVQFALMPYPNAAFLRDTAFESASEQNQAIQQRFTRYLNEKMLPQINKSQPTVLVSHVHVRGVTPRSGFRVTEEQDVVFEPGDIPTHFAYVAYGHIHQAQTAVPNAPWVRYCGSVERLDAGEKEDDKSVVLVEVGPAGRVGEPELLPLASTPIYQIVIEDPDTQIAGLAAKYPDAQNALVHYTLHYQPGTHNLDALRREIHAQFPFWYGYDPQRRRGPNDAPPSPPPNLANVQKTVRDYLAPRLAGDPNRDDLLNLMNDLMSEEATA